MSWLIRYPGWAFSISSGWDSRKIRQYPAHIPPLPQVQCLAAAGCLRHSGSTTLGCRLNKGKDKEFEKVHCGIIRDLPVGTRGVWQCGAGGGRDLVTGYHPGCSGTARCRMEKMIKATQNYFKRIAIRNGDTATPKSITGIRQILFNRCSLERSFSSQFEVSM